MRIERPNPATLRVTLSAYEMATLTAAARWAHEGCPGEIEPAAREQLGRVLENYDEASSRLAGPAH